VSASQPRSTGPSHLDWGATVFRRAAPLSGPHRHYARRGATD